MENQDNNPSKPNHWEARTLLGEYMNRGSYTAEQVISEFTLALLESSGWYKVHYYTGGLMRFGKHKGCEFLQGQCDNVGNSQNEFIADLKNRDTSSCSSGRQSRTFFRMESKQVPDFAYYIKKFDNFRGLEYADYCFGASDVRDEKYHYIGNCKYNNGLYGKINYRKSSGNYEQLSNVDLPLEFGEKSGINSFCVLTSVLYKDNTKDSLIFVKNNEIVHPMCFLMYCSEKSLTVYSFEQYIVCPRSGGKVYVNDPKYEGYLYCPDYNLICSGTVICNDIFDCVDKKSEPRNDTYEYDYVIQTNQNATKIKTDEIIIGYELSENGKCPKNCQACREYRRCFRCLEGYKLIGINETDKTSEIYCINETIENLNKFHYHIEDEENNIIYYPCTEFCINCTNRSICISCQENYELFNDNTKCKEIIQHCAVYNNDSTECLRCKNTTMDNYIDDYYLLEENKNACYNINTRHYFSLFCNINQLLLQ